MRAVSPFGWVPHIPADVELKIVPHPSFVRRFVASVRDFQRDPLQTLVAPGNDFKKSANRMDPAHCRLEVDRRREAQGQKNAASHPSALRAAIIGEDKVSRGEAPYRRLNIANEGLPREPRDLRARPLNFQPCVSLLDAEGLGPERAPS